MFANHINTADAVSRWAGLGVKLPTALQKSLTTFEAIRWVEVGHAVQFDLTDITAANAEEKVVEFAQRLMPSMPAAGDTHRTPLEEAKNRMLAEAARDVVGKASAALPVVIEQLTPEFDKHAAAYVAAIDLLPDTIDSDSLVQAGATPKYPTGLKARGKRLWRELHESANFGGSPEIMAVIEEACYLADEIKRLRDIVRKAGAETRVAGYNGQPASMPEVDDLRKSQSLLLSMLKSIRVDADPGDGKLTRSQVGQMAASARWHG